VETGLVKPQHFPMKLDISVENFVIFLHRKSQTNGIATINDK